MNQECVFCKIVHGEIPAAVVYEDSDFIGFLDINPRSKGHTLIIPKKHYPTLLDMNEDDLQKLGIVLKHVANHVMNVLNAKGFNVLNNNGESAGQVVKHVHFHIIPRYEEKGHSLEVAFPVDEKAKEELKETQNKIGRISPVEYNNPEPPQRKVEEKKEKKEKKVEDYEGRIFDEIETIPDM